MRFTLYADGGSRGNPGPAGSGAIIRDEAGSTVVTVSEFLGTATNNVAEYMAVLRGLESLRDALGDAAAQAEVEVYMDSMLVVRQMSGEWKLKNEGLKPLAARVHEAMRSFDRVTFAHIYRDKNVDADRLANEAMDRGV
jgi:ribonuclease HI